MALFATDVVESSSTTGTGTYNLNGPATNYRGFAAGFVTGDTPYYVVRNADDTKYEINRFGIYTQGTPDTLSRGVYLSSNGNAPVNWVSGDLPLLVYVPSAVEMLEHISQGFKSTARSVYLKYGLWFKKDTPSVNTDTLMLYNGVIDIPFATVSNVTNTATSLAALPPGIIMDYAGDTAPGGWVLCYGQSLSRTTYSALFAIIGVKYGNIDGATFKVPDLRGRTTFGIDNMGGTVAGVLQYMNAVAPINPYLLGAIGGTQYEQVPFAATNVAISGASSVSGTLPGSMYGTVYGNTGGSVTGTMWGYTQGELSAHTWGQSNNAGSGWGGSYNSGPLLGDHSHWVDIYGNAYGSLRTYVNEGSMSGTFSGSMAGTVYGNVSGTLTGTATATGGTASGTTNWADNMPPFMMMNKIISTGGV